MSSKDLLQVFKEITMGPSRRWVSQSGWLAAFTSAAFGMRSASETGLIIRALELYLIILYFPDSQMLPWTPHVVLSFENFCCDDAIFKSPSKFEFEGSFALKRVKRVLTLQGRWISSVKSCRTVLKSSWLNGFQPAWPISIFWAEIGSKARV